MSCSWDEYYKIQNRVRQPPEQADTGDKIQAVFGRSRRFDAEKLENRARYGRTPAIQGSEQEQCPGPMRKTPTRVEVLRGRGATDLWDLRKGSKG
jgi:hypothetical protein